MIEQREQEMQTCTAEERRQIRLYDAVKSDIFSAAVTLFVMSLKFSPFRRAVGQDPHFKRLAGKEKHKFWKIYNNLKTSASFKDLFEKLSCANPATRLSVEQILAHQFVQHKHGTHPTQEIQKEIIRAHETV